MFNYFDFSKSFDSLNRYQLHEELGSGAYGQVRRAIDSETGNTVALKNRHKQAVTSISVSAMK